MLKKRILASSLASVMALSSVSVVAFADETATVDYNAKDVVSRAELKEYIKTFDDFVKKELDAYGDIQTDRLNNAIAHAKGVAEDSNATNEEFVAAFQMLKAVANSLQIYTGTELQELIDSCKSKYDTENVLNEALGDKRWDDDTWTAFEDAYEEADRYVDSDDGRIISDAYCTLEDALNSLKEKENVKKSDFRAVYNEYENIISSLKKYQPWRRGVCTVNATRGGAKMNGEKVDLTLVSYVTYEDLGKIVYGTSKAKYVDNGETVVLDNTNDLDAGTWLSVGGTGNTVEELVKGAYDELTEKAKATNRSSDPDIVEAYKTAKQAVEVFKGWLVDDVDSGNARDIKKLNDNNRAMLIKEEYANTWITALIAATQVSGNDALALADGKVTVTEDCGADFKLTIDKKTGCLQIKPADGTYLNTVTAGVSEAKAFEEGDDITKYIPINGWTIDDASGKPFAAELNAALDMSDAYYAEEIQPKDDRDFKTAANAAGVTALDPDKNIKEYNGSYAEYTLIFRNLQYVYDDINASFKDRFSLADVEKLIAQADTLIEATADASELADVNTALVNARKSAKEWVAAAKANGSYKANKKITYTNAQEYVAGWDGATAKSSTDAYVMLKKYYDECNDKFKKYPVSYGEVAELIATVGDGLASEVFGSSAASIRGLASTLAYRLSVLDAKGDANEPFNEDRDLIVYNRVFKDGNDAEKALLNNYNALVKAVADATKEPEKPTVAEGDADLDGTVTAKDALFALKASAGAVTLTDAQKAAADVDKDGTVTAKDALAILKASAQG